MGVFRFKQFSLDDSRCAMKIGTDAVLLSAWAPVPVQGEVLDIGCGCGVISMMLAQRNPMLKITGIEIDPEAAGQASQNVLNSPFSERINIIEGDIRLYKSTIPKTFHFIVSNPPFFQKSLKSLDRYHNESRHDVSLDFDELLSAVPQLLKQDGSFCLILPADTFPRFRNKALIHGLYPAELLYVHHKPDNPAVRVLGRFIKSPLALTVEGQLYIHHPNGGWSEEYLELTGDFYLFA